MSERRALLRKARARREEAGFMSRLDYFLVLPALLSNTFIAAFESTIAASTQSSIGADFNASDNIAWVATSYMIVSTALSPLYGRASDLFGRTIVFVFAVSVFSLGCLACGLSQSLGQMIAARVFCGIGGAGLITAAQACTWDILPFRLRPLYQGFNNTIYGLGGALGASLGGFLADSIGWRFAYFFPVPLGLFAITVFLSKVRPKIQELRAGEKTTLSVSDIDYIGSLLLMTAITILMVVVNLGGDEIPWNSPWVPALLALVVLFCAVFFRHEKNVPLPVLPLKLLANRHMASLVGLNFFGSMAITGSLYLIPLFFQTTLLTSAAVASRRLLFPTLAAPIGSVLTGIFLHRYRSKAYLSQRLGAFILFGGTLALLSLSLQDNSAKGDWAFGIHLLWVHFGMGICFISSLMNILDSAGSDHAAASSMVFLIRSLGSVIGISGSQAVFQNVLQHQLISTITGPHSKKTIRAIRSSISYLRRLDPDVQKIAVRAYTVASQASFAFLATVAGIGFVCLLGGIGAETYAEVNNSYISIRQDEGQYGTQGDDDPETEPPLTEGLPALE
ncbi:hypothetical protein IAU59_001213 [Kwoniella sp. CBS 9459]